MAKAPTRRLSTRERGTRTNFVPPLTNVRLANRQPQEYMENWQKQGPNAWRYLATVLQRNQPLLLSLRHRPCLLHLDMTLPNLESHPVRGKLQKRNPNKGPDLTLGVLIKP